MSGIWRAAIDVIRLTFAHERLAPAPAKVSPQHRGTTRTNLRRLFALETLPLDAPAPRVARRRWIHWLFAPETLPHDPVPPPRRARSRVAALFAPEKLDDP